MIVDDHVLFTEGLIALLNEVDEPDIEVIHVSHDGEDILRWFSKRRVHLVFLDLNLGKINGLDLIEPIKLRSPETRIMIVSGYSDGNLVKTAFLNGADGYVLKGSPLEELRQGILTIMGDNTFMGKGVQVTAKCTDKRNKDRQAYRQTRSMDSYALMNDLTKREQQILELITQAYSNKEIARKLYISDQTVSVHRKNIMRKLGVSNTVSLVKVAQSLSISG